jgi:hypothetical protein
MSEEFGRWLDAAKPGLPTAVVLFVVIVATVVVTVVLVRKSAAAAAKDRKQAARLWHNIDCVTEPTVAIDMSVLTAHPDKAKFNPRNVLVRLRERRKVGEEFVPPAEWTAEWTADELAAVKAMNDRSGWPNKTYQPRGWLPRLRRPQPVAVVPVTPAEIGERIKRIKAEKKAVSK